MSETTTMIGQVSGDWIELVGAAIGVVIIVGSAVVRSLGELAKKRRARTPSPVSERDAAANAEMEDLAARRRAQLRGAGGTGGADPDNMTMAERMERARAKQAYEQRARQMAAQQSPATIHRAPAPQPDLQQRIEERRIRREAQQRQREEQEQLRRETRRDQARQSEDQNRRAKIAQERARQQREAALRQQAEQSRRSAEAAQRKRETAEAQAKRSKDERKRRERESAAVAAAADRPASVMSRHRGSAGIIAALRHPVTLRQAIVLKEVLDRPVGLRD